MLSHLVPFLLDDTHQVFALKGHVFWSHGTVVLVEQLKFALAVYDLPCKWPASWRPKHFHAVLVSITGSASNKGNYRLLKARYKVLGSRPGV
jgi:hypothetical protein